MLVNKYTLPERLQLNGLAMRVLLLYYFLRGTALKKKKYNWSNWRPIDSTGASIIGIVYCFNIPHWHCKHSVTLNFLKLCWKLMVLLKIISCPRPHHIVTFWCWFPCIAIMQETSSIAHFLFWCSVVTHINCDRAFGIFPIFFYISFIFYWYISIHKSYVMKMIQLTFT